MSTKSKQREKKKNKASESSTNFLDPDATKELIDNPLAFTLKIFAKKVRNIQKRVEKLNTIRQKQVAGERLEEEQRQALKQQPVVQQQLDTYVEIAQHLERYEKITSEYKSHEDELRDAHEASLREEAAQLAVNEYKEQEAAAKKLAEEEEEQRRKDAEEQERLKQAEEEEERLAEEKRLAEEQEKTAIVEEDTLVPEEIPTATNTTDMANILETMQGNVIVAEALPEHEQLLQHIRKKSPQNAASEVTTTAVTIEQDPEHVDGKSIKSFIRLQLILEPLRRLPVEITHQILETANMSQKDQMDLIRASVIFNALPHEHFHDAVDRIGSNVNSFLKQHEDSIRGDPMGDAMSYEQLFKAAVAIGENEQLIKALIHHCATTGAPPTAGTAAASQSSPPLTGSSPDKPRTSTTSPEITPLKMAGGDLPSGLTLGSTTTNALQASAERFDHMPSEQIVPQQSGSQHSHFTDARAPPPPSNQVNPAPASRSPNQHSAQALYAAQQTAQPHAQMVHPNTPPRLLEAAGNIPVSSPPQHHSPPTQSTANMYHPQQYQAPHQTHQISHHTSPPQQHPSQHSHMLSQTPQMSTASSSTLSQGHPAVNPQQTSQHPPINTLLDGQQYMGGASSQRMSSNHQHVQSQRPLTAASPPVASATVAPSSQPSQSTLLGQQGQAQQKLPTKQASLTDNLHSASQSPGPQAPQMASTARQPPNQMHMQSAQQQQQRMTQSTHHQHQAQMADMQTQRVPTANNSMGQVQSSSHISQQQQHHQNQHHPTHVLQRAQPAPSQPPQAAPSHHHQTRPPMPQQPTPPKVHPSTEIVNNLSANVNMNTAPREEPARQPEPLESRLNAMQFTETINHEMPKPDAESSLLAGSGDTGAAQQTAAPSEPVAQSTPPVARVSPWGNFNHTNHFAGQVPPANAKPAAEPSSESPAINGSIPQKYRGSREDTGKREYRDRRNGDRREGRGGFRGDRDGRRNVPNGDRNYGGERKPATTQSQRSALPHGAPVPSQVSNQVSSNPKRQAPPNGMQSYRGPRNNGYQRTGYQQQPTSGSGSRSGTPREYKPNGIAGSQTANANMSQDGFMQTRQSAPQHQGYSKVQPQGGRQYQQQAHYNNY